MKKHIHWHTIFLLVLLALSVQGCLGIGDNNSNQNFKTVSTGNGQNLKINTSDQALFRGKIYFTQGRNLLVIDGARNVHQLTHGYDVRDPSVSANGKWIAFVIRYKYSALLVYMPTNSTHWTILRDGSGKYVPNPGYAPKSTHHWYAQPSWAPDNTHLLFLSDLEKEDWYAETAQDAPLLDMQVFSTTISNPSQTQDIAYADYGDGGDRDATYRPNPPASGHDNQIAYTHYTYDKSETKQIIQIYLEDASMIAKHPNVYHPGTAGSGYDPGVPLTPAIPDLANMMPAFSPDGNSLAYVRRIDPSTEGLYVMQVPNGVTNTPNDKATEQRALQPYQKSSLIVKGQYVSQPAWSPDGKQIAYLYYQNNEFNIWLANVTTDLKTGAYAMQGNPVPLTSGGIDGDSRPFWTK